jgi:diguanylate cyclase (GGDEF)-like protein
MASGDVVNTAARLQSAAPVNGILVGETTYHATRSTIEYRDAPPVEAKGKSEPVPVWQAIAARSRFGDDLEQRRRSPLVGRDRELGILADALDRCRRELAPQLLTLIGVPGIGKSRLVTELFQIVYHDPDLIWWRQGRSLPYGEGLPYWALGEIVKAQAGILETDPTDAAERKLRAMVADVVADVSDADWVEEHLRPLVGLSVSTDGGGDRRSEAFAAWRQFLEALAEQRPLVLVSALLLDLDHFKQINDEHGHALGDDVLAALGATIQAPLRASDFVGRYGGEEFVILLPDTARQEAEVVAEKIRVAVASISVSGVTRPITASIGVAVLPDDAADSVTLLRNADRALYAAKSNGRNRIEVTKRVGPTAEAVR